MVRVMLIISLQCFPLPVWAAENVLQGQGVASAGVTYLVPHREDFLRNLPASDIRVGVNNGFFGGFRSRKIAMRTAKERAFEDLRIQCEEIGGNISDRWVEHTNCDIDWIHFLPPLGSYREYVCEWTVEGNCLTE